MSSLISIFCEIKASSETTYRNATNNLTQQSRLLAVNRSLKNLSIKPVSPLQNLEQVLDNVMSAPEYLIEFGKILLIFRQLDQREHLAKTGDKKKVEADSGWNK